MRVSWRRLGVLTVCLFMMCGIAAQAMADSAEYLAELQLLGPSEFFAAQVSELSVRVTNRGHFTWSSVTSDPSHPVRVSYHWADAHGKVVTHDGLRTELARDLAVGESLLMKTWVLAPPTPGTYTLVLDLVREGVTWFANQGSSPLQVPAVEVQRAGRLTWQRGRILLIVGGTSLLLFLMGVGTTKVLAPEVPVVLCPLMGVATIVALSYYVSLLGVSMAQAKWGIVAVGVGTTVAAMAVRKPPLGHRRRENLWLTLLTVVMLLGALLPLWDFGRLSSVQNTYASYFVAMSEYWKLHSLQELPALNFSQPLDYLVRERMVHHYIDAPPFLNAFVATTFDLDSYETYAILTALLLAMLPATLYWVARTAFCMSSWASGLAACLVLFNITYHRWSFQGQLTFISGLLFLIVALGAVAQAFTKRGRAAFGALSLSTLLALYPALLPYALAPLFCYGGFLIYYKTLTLRDLSLTLLKVIGFLISINPSMTYYVVVSGVSAAAQMREDWHNIPGYPTISELLGLLPHFSAGNGGSLVQALAFSFALFAIGICGYGLYRARKEGRWLLLTAVTPYVFGALIIVMLMDYAYGYYKHMAVTLFAFLLAFAYGLEGFCKNRGPRRQLAAVLGVGAFVGLHLLAFKAILAQEKPDFVPSTLASISSIKSKIRKGENVFLNEDMMSLQLWTSYFLWGRPLSIPPVHEPWGWWGFSSVFGRGDPKRFYNPQVTYTLTKWDEIVRPWPEPIWHNSTYLLHAGPPALVLSQGWHRLEGGPQPSRWMAQQGTLHVLARDDMRNPIRLRTTLVPITAPLTLEVFLGDEPLGAFIAQDPSRPATFQSRPFSAPAGVTLTIRSPAGCFEPSRLFGGHDHRCLSARFLEVSLVEGDE
jgi:hypothetical protein